MTHNDPDSLLVSQVLRQYGDQHLRVDERTVQAAMRPAWRVDHGDFASVDQGFLALLRTGSVFVLDLDHVEQVMQSQPPELPELPPLPFPRVIVEAQREGVRAPIMRFERQAVLHLDQPDEPDRSSWVELALAGVIEQEQGHSWDVYIPFQTARRPDDFTVASFTLTPAGVADNSMLDDARKSGIEAGVMATMQEVARIALNCAHLIVARGVPHEPINFPRPTRRRFQKRYRQEMPRAYFVNLHGAGGEEREPGRSDREYHVRWMVRGHWRHFQDGRRTWIAPYVKGPPGAPWRGRPIHVDRS